MSLLRYSIGVPHQELLIGLEDMTEPEDRINFMYRAMRRIVRSPFCTCVYCTYQEEDNPLLVFDEDYNTRHQEPRKAMTIQETIQSGEKNFQVVTKPDSSEAHDTSALTFRSTAYNGSSKRKTDLSRDGQLKILADYVEEQRKHTPSRQETPGAKLDKLEASQGSTKTLKRKLDTLDSSNEKVLSKSTVCEACQKSHKKCHHRVELARSTALAHIESYMRHKTLQPVQPVPSMPSINESGRAIATAAGTKQLACTQAPKNGKDSVTPVLSPPASEPPSPKFAAQNLTSSNRHYGYLYPSFESKALRSADTSAPTSPRTFLRQAQAVANATHTLQIPTPASTPPPECREHLPNESAPSPKFPELPVEPKVPIRNNLWLDAENVKWTKDWSDSWVRYTGT